jgi:glycosyltransferase involved in cell wall biosynthesis
MAGTLWIDIEDLFHYTRVHARPSGIQRVAFEISRTLHARCGMGGTVRFVRYDPVHNSFRIVEWTEVETAFHTLTEEARTPPETRFSGDAARHTAARRFVRLLVYRLPESLHFQVRNALVAQDRAFRSWAHLFAALAHGLCHAPRRLAKKLCRRKAFVTESGNSESRRSESSFAAVVAAGDTLLTLGAFWSHPDYAALIEKHRARFGLRYALLVYDIIPLRRPEWCERNFVWMFRDFFDRIVPVCDTILTISEATAADVMAYMREQDMALSGPVVPVPMGSGFGSGRPAGMMPRSDRLPPAGSYVLFVSTIEARKNHALMFRVWRRLLEELQQEVVPTLVFAGRIGWLVDDLMRQIANADYLDGKIIVLEDPNDTELAALYQGCQFTVFPSLYEGWGLPVTESLSFGKPCLIADRTSLPEAGGDLVRRFDPEDLNAAFAAVREIILDPKGLDRWEERIKREFRPVPWSASADALLAALGYGATRNMMAGSTCSAMALTEAVADR